MKLNKQIRFQVILVAFLFFLSMLTLNNVSATDDYHTGTTVEGRIFGPVDILIPYMEKIGPQAIDPKFAIGPTGTVSVVYADSDDHNVYYMDNASGSWSTPVQLLDSQYINFEENAITTDGSGNVYIITDGAIGNYFTNRSGSWEEINLPLNHFYYNIKTNDAGDHVYITTMELDTNPTPPDDELVYINITYTGPTTYTYDVQNFDFSDVEYYNNIDFLSMDVNSTGYVHCVYKGFAHIYYFIINPDGTQSGPYQISQLNGETMSHCNWPSLAIDSDDKVHVVYTKSNYDSSNHTIESISGLYYEEVNSSTYLIGSNAVKISNHPGGRAYITTGIDNGVRHIGSYQSFDQVTQIEYITDKNGDWSENWLTNFSYSLYVQGMSVRDIKVNPATNEPVIISTYRGHMEIYTMMGGRWGEQIEFKVELASLNVQYPDNMELTMDITNIDDRAIDFDTVAGVFSYVDMEFDNPEGNLQAVGEIPIDVTETLNWDIHFTGKFEGQIHVSLLVDDQIDDRGYSGVYFEIGVALSIPGYSIWIFGLVTVVVIGILYKKYKK